MNDYKKRHIKVTYENGDFSTTDIYGTKEEIASYYVGNKFNLGSVEDNMQTAISVEFVE